MPTKKPRILLECTHVYNHPQDNSGIQRVVRNVINHSHSFNDCEAIAVRFKDDHLYRVMPPLLHASQIPATTADEQAAPDHTSPRLHQRIVRPLKKRLQPYPQLYRMAFTSYLHMMNAARYSKRLYRKLRQHQPKETPFAVHSGDVLVLLDASWHDDYSHAIKRLKAQGVCVVALVHDLIPITHPQFFDDHLVSIFKKWFAWLSQTADGYIAVSRTIAHQVREQVTPHRNDQPWFDHFRLGHDLDLAHHDKDEVRSSLRERLNKPDVYLSVSTIEPRKNHAYILDAFDLLWAQGSDAKLLFIGKIGWKIDKLITRIKTHPQWGKKLFMLNDASDSELGYAYDHSEALIFASYAEGFGLPLIEALGHGLPVLASDIPVFHEVCSEHAAYFDLDNPASLQRAICEKAHRHTTTAAWQWPDWQAASHELLACVLRHCTKK